MDCKEIGERGCIQCQMFSTIVVQRRGGINTNLAQICKILKHIRVHFPRFQKRGILLCSLTWRDSGTRGTDAITRLIIQQQKKERCRRHKVDEHPYQVNILFCVLFPSELSAPKSFSLIFLFCSTTTTQRYETP